MCRLLAYLGPPVRLGPLLTGTEHSLHAQSYRAREMISGTVNADGFGVGWYMPEVEPTPARYLSTLPIWADTNLESLGRKLSSPCVLACVRGATPGMGYGTANTPPFVRGRHLFAHNGFVQDFRAALMRTLRAELSDELYAGIEGSTDSEHLFALWLERLRRQPEPGPAALATALRETVEFVAHEAQGRGLEALLNLVATDGDTLVAVRHATGERAPSLYLHVGDASEGVLLASEPLFASERWRAVPPGSVVLAVRGQGVEVTPS